MEMWLWFKRVWCKFSHSIKISFVTTFLHEKYRYNFSFCPNASVHSFSRYGCLQAHLVWNYFGYTMPLIIAMRMRFIFYLLNHQATEINGDQIWPDCNIRDILTPWKVCSYVQYFSYQLHSLLSYRYEFEIYKHHSCQLCLAPLGS